MWQHFKKVFLTGIFAIAPLAMTYWILKITFELNCIMANENLLRGRSYARYILSD